MTKSRPAVSIGMPVFNGEAFLERALESLLSQRDADFELLISDNCSTDRTPEICRRYITRDSRIHYARNTSNLGIVENFNRVARAASGDFFMFAACDDEWEPTFVETLRGVLLANPEIALAHAGYDWIDSSGTVMRTGKTGWLVGSYPEFRSPLSFRGQRSRVFNFCLGYVWRNPFPLYGLFRLERLRACLPFSYIAGSAKNSDCLFFLRFLLKGNRVEHTPEILFHYRDRERVENDYLDPRTPRGLQEHSEQALRSAVRQLIKTEDLPNATRAGLLVCLPILEGTRRFSIQLAKARRVYSHAG